MAAAMQNITLDKAILTSALLVGLLWACARQPPPSPGEPIIVSEANRALLEGTWEGDWNSRSTDGTRRWDTPMTITIAGETATVHLKRDNMTWESPLDVKDGKVLITMGFAPRELTLSRAGDVHVLSGTFDHTYQDWDRTTTVTLAKE